jgi:hypothetical protein
LLARDRDAGILVLFVFVAAVMESVAARLLAMPVITIGLVALAFVMFFAVLGLTTLLFASVGRERALALGLTAAQRKVGLMLAATGGALPDLAWLYFAFCYFPMYLSPLLLQSTARRMIDGDEHLAVLAPGREAGPSRGLDLDRQTDKHGYGIYRRQQSKIQQRIDAIRRDPNYYAADNRLHEVLVAEMADLPRQLHGEQA